MSSTAGGKGGSKIVIKSATPSVAGTARSIDATRKGSDVSSKDEKETKASDSRDKYILNKHLPRCRQQRQVSRSVLDLNLPQLRDTPTAQRSALLRKKLRLCSYVFDFYSEGAESVDVKEKEIKRATLAELVSYLRNFKPAFSEEELKDVFEMLASNLFRPLPPSSWEQQGAVFNPEEDEPQADCAWPHLEGVYDFLLHLASSSETDGKLLDKFFSRRFVVNLLDLFDSEDSREREYLKLILHRIYGNFTPLRPFIRKAINNVFFRFVYESDRHNGVAELLEVLGSIINGFARPLKEQHKHFLKKVLLPLHKATWVVIFHAQLSFCVTQFLEKDPTLAPMVVGTLLKLWPITCSKKMVMFLNELDEILERVSAEHLEDTITPLFQLIARCINSPHFQVSERAIYLFNSEHVLRLLSSDKEGLLPIITKAIYSNVHVMNPHLGLCNTPDGKVTISGDLCPESSHVRSDNGGGEGGLALGGGSRGKWNGLGHWNANIVELTNEVWKMLNDLDSPLVSQTIRVFETSSKATMAEREKRRGQWEALEAKLRSSPTPPPASTSSSSSSASSSSAVELTAVELKVPSTLPSSSSTTATSSSSSSSSSAAPTIVLTRAPSGHHLTVPSIVYKIDASRTAVNGAPSS